MTEGSFHWGTFSNSLYLWQNGGGDPTGNVSTGEPEPGFSAIMLLRAIGRECWFLAHHWSLGATYTATP